MNTLYICVIARKRMVAIVARICEQRIKLDSVVILNEPQGMDQSSFFAKLGGKWLSDSLTISDMKDEAAPEKLQGYWILELGELAGLKKMGMEKVKAFITRQDDKFRYSYSAGDHLCQRIIVSSTNNGDGFLRDVTGNRRFWPVTCTANSPHRPWEVESIVPQLWAEAWQLYKNGEKLFLTPAEEKQAEMEQTAALESDVREGTFTVENILVNEKYKGDATLQKMHCTDYLLKTLVVNDGSVVPKYYAQNSHPTITSPEASE